MPIAISEFLLKNKILISIQSFLVLLIGLFWSFGYHIVDPHTKTEITILLLVQIIATLVIVCLVLFLACLDLRRKNISTEHRRSLISQWRKMVYGISNKQDNSDKSVSYLLERHKAYYSLKPHLSHDTIREIARKHNFIAGSTIDASLAFIINEIARLEKEWDLM